MGYTTTRTEYRVTVSHPTNYHSGTHTLTVRTVSRPDGVVIRSVDGSGFGCGRDQLVKTDKAAVESFLAEHACRVVKIVKAPR